MKTITIIISILILFTAIYFIFLKPSTYAINGNYKLLVDGKADCIFSGNFSNQYSGTITGIYKGTATINNLTTIFDIKINNASFSGIFRGQNNNNKYKGNIKGTIIGNIKGTYEIKKPFPIIIPIIIILFYLVYKYFSTSTTFSNYRENEIFAKEKLKDLFSIDNIISIPCGLEVPQKGTLFFFLNKDDNTYISIFVKNKGGKKDIHSPNTFPSLYLAKEYRRQFEFYYYAPTIPKQKKRKEGEKPPLE